MNSVIIKTIGPLSPIKCAGDSTCNGGFINQVTFKDFEAYPDNIKEWIRITARARFNDLLTLARLVKEGKEIKEAILTTIKQNA